LLLIRVAIIPYNVCQVGSAAFRDGKLSADAATLKAWIVRASEIDTIDALFSPEQHPAIAGGS
jgi:hypothetical protein